MFTGIIQDTGRILSSDNKGDSKKFRVEVHDIFLQGVKTGDSISVNGACMTVESYSKDNFEFTTIAESLSKTNLGKLETGSYINLEKSMTMNSKLDGHIVSGHVDTIGLVDKVIENEDSWEFFIKFSNKFSDNVIYKGSIAINGVSLTIAEIVKEGNKNTTIRISIIPHTFNHTNFKFLREKDIVNIEFDLLGKYVKRILRK
ncbi:MAG: riboflavin synthase [Bacteroidetes bacterium]|nr:riboflavin synthase [Bacteroidota bacterium]